MAPTRSGKAGPVTQYCIRCKSRKSIQGFDIERSICAGCRPQKNSKGKIAEDAGKRTPGKVTSTSAPAAMKWRCPKCVQQVPVDPAWQVLVEHLNRRGERCSGSGHAIPQVSRDALDHRAPGSFEGGSRR